MKPIILTIVFTIAGFFFVSAQNGPVAYIDSPLNESIARPYIHFKLRTEEKDSCILSVWYGTPESSSEVIDDIKFLSVFDTTLDMSKFQGKSNSLWASVYNPKTGLRTNKYILTLYVDSSHYLQEFKKVDGKIKDFKSNKILYVDDSVFRNLTILDLNTQQKSSLYFDEEKGNSLEHEKAYLTPSGAIFETSFPTYALSYDWNGGQLFDLGRSDDLGVVKGDYGIWVSVARLYLRQFSKKTNSVIADNVLNVTNNNQLTDNRQVVYTQSTSGYNIFSYKNDKYQQITNDDVSLLPVTDGHSVVFRKSYNLIDYIYLYNGIDSIKLSEFGNYYSDIIQPPDYYQINNHFIAYLRDSLSSREIWLRNKNGIDKQVSFFSPFSKPNRIEFLNEYGDIFYQYNYAYNYYSRFYYNNKTQEQPKEICSNLGTLFYEDSSWHVAIGRTLFKINVSSSVLPLSLLLFDVQKNALGNQLYWSTAQEINTDRFEVERSNNSRDFASIGTVRSLNNGKTKNDYAFTDAQPLKAVNYYRLKMLDKDGKFTYSVIRNINNTASFDVTIYPNPVQQNLTLNFNTQKAMDVQVEIVNAEGKKIYTKKMQLPYGASIQSINLAAFKAGNYFVKFITADGQTGLRFVKQ